MEIDPSVVFLILTNLAYLLPAIEAWLLGIYEVAAANIAVAVVSSMHHFCYDTLFCPLEVTQSMQLVDIALAHYAVSRAVIFLVNYDPIKANGRLRLVRHTYADFAQVIYDALIIFSVISFGNSLVSSLLLTAYAFSVIAFSLIVHWRMKAKTFKLRFNWKIFVAIAFGILGVVLFVMEEQIGRPFHSLWHICGGLTSLFALLGASGHIARKSLAPLFGNLFGTR